MAKVMPLGNQLPKLVPRFYSFSLQSLSPPQLEGGRAHHLVIESLVLAGSSLAG